MKSCDEPKQQNENTGDRKQGANLGKKYMRKEKHTALNISACVLSLKTQVRTQHG